MHIVLEIRICLSFFLFFFDFDIVLFYANNVAISQTQISLGLDHLCAYNVVYLST